MDPAEALRTLGGVARYRELTRVTTRREIEHAVAGGAILRPRRNCYVLTDVDEARRAAAVAGGTVSHLSAALHFEWKVRHPPPKPCITLPRSARRPTGPKDVVAQLFWQDLATEDVEDGVTTRVATVIACARAYGFDTALCVADSALREGKVTRQMLLEAAERSPRTGRRKALAVVRAADGRADNPFESSVRAIARRVPGLDVEPQGEVPGVGRVDLLDRRLGIVVEAESFEFHGDKEGFNRDVHRYTACARCGLVVCRFTWRDVMYDERYVHEALVDVVAWRSRQLGLLVG